MAEADFSELTNSLSGGTLRRGVTAGVTTPTGGGSFAFGANSIASTAGAWGLYTNQANFSPTPANKGGSIRAALKRGPGVGFAPLIFIGLQSNDVNASGYLLGLTDGDPARIALVKGQLVNGIPDVAPGTLGVLRRSDSTVEADTWQHLRLDMVVNTNGDVVLNCFRNLGNVSSPSWVAIPGITQVIDDVLGVNTGSTPFTNGRMGFGGRWAETNRRAYWDYVESVRQT